MLKFTPYASSSDGNFYLLEDGPHRLAIEAGIRFRAIQEALDFRVSSLDGCLISHGHGDHSRAIKDLMKAGVNCYMSQEAATDLGLSGHRLKAIGTLSEFHVGAFVVKAFDVVHDAPGTVGFMVLGPSGKRLLYLSDTAYVKYRFNAINILAIECNHSRELARRNVVSGAIPFQRYRRTTTNHLSLERLIDLLKANDLSTVQEIYLLHLSDANSDEVEFKRAVAAATGIPTYIAAKFGEEVQG